MISRLFLFSLFCGILALNAFGQKSDTLPLPPPPPPPPPPYPIICSETYKIVDEMPRFYQEDCEGCSDVAEKNACAQDALFAFLEKNLRYPVEQCVQGTCIVNFVVEKGGAITDIRVVRDIGAGCGKEAARVVRLMADTSSWVAGKHRGRAVRVQLNLPVRFSQE